MNESKLYEANKVYKRINELKEAIQCFEWQPEIDTIVSTNPRLVIEFDGGDGREELRVPMSLNNTLIDFLKSQIKEQLVSAQKEFDLL